MHTLNRLRCWLARKLFARRSRVQAFNGWLDRVAVLPYEVDAEEAALLYDDGSSSGPVPSVHRMVDDQSV